MWWLCLPNGVLVTVGTKVVSVVITGVVVVLANGVLVTGGTTAVEVTLGAVVVSVGACVVSVVFTVVDETLGAVVVSVTLTVVEVIPVVDARVVVLGTVVDIKFVDFCVGVLLNVGSPVVTSVTVKFLIYSFVVVMISGVVVPDMKMKGKKYLTKQSYCHNVFLQDNN